MEHIDQQTILRYISDDLSEGEMLKVDQHFASCPECADHVRTLHYIRDNFDNLIESWTAEEHGRVFRQWQTAKALKEKEPGRNFCRHIIEICYEITGKVISKIDSIIEGTGLVYQLELVPKGVNLSESPSRILSQLLKESNTAFLQISFLEHNTVREIEVELLSKDKKMRIRPFTISVYDMEENVIEGAVSVGIIHNAPRFPNPSPGFYCFVVEWENSKETLNIEVR